jgi:hypothetical protein
MSSYDLQQMARDAMAKADAALAATGAPAVAGPHEHPISEVTGLQAALDAKGTSNFSGEYADLTGKPALFSGSYADLTGKPSLGTAAAKNVGAGADEVSAGNHTHPGGSEAFPVGSVFIAVVNTNPGTLLGYGTWAAFAAGRMLIGHNAGDTDFDTAEETGGSKTSTALIAHTHVQDAHTHVQNAHTHVQDAHSHIITSQTATTGGATSYEHGTLDTSSAEAEATETTATAVAVNQNATAVNQNATAVNQPAGSGNSFSLMNPYIVVFMWKRTA